MNSIANYVEEDAKFVHIIRLLHEHTKEVKKNMQMRSDSEFFILQLKELNENIQKQKCLQTVNSVQSLPWVTEQPTPGECDMDDWTTILSNMNWNIYVDNNTISFLLREIHTHFEKSVYATITFDLLPKILNLVHKANRAESQLSSKISDTTFKFFDDGGANGLNSEMFEHIAEIMAMPRFQKYTHTTKGNKKLIGWDKYSSYYTCIIDQPRPKQTYYIKQEMFLQEVNIGNMTSDIMCFKYFYT